MVWISSTLGGPTALANAGIAGIGSDIRDFLYHVSSSGDEFIVTWDQSYTPANTVRYLYIYKNQVLEETFTVLSALDADVVNVHYSGTPCCIRRNELFYVHGYNDASSDLQVTTNKYNFDTGDSTMSIDTQSVKAGNPADNVASITCGIAYDPLGDVLYVLGGGCRWDVGYREDGVLRIWQMDNTGVEDHRVLNTTNIGESQRFCQSRILAMDNTVYFYYHVYDADGGGDTRKVCKIDGAQTDTTATVTYTGPTTASPSDLYGIIGNWGLYVKYNETTLRSQNDAVTWDLSSYMDTNCHISLLSKTASTEDYEFLTEKSGVIYWISCDNGGTVTQLGTRMVNSDYTCHPEVIGYGSPFTGGQGWWPRRCAIGSAKEFLTVSPLTRSVD